MSVNTAVAQWSELARANAARFGVSPALVLAIIEAESNGVASAMRAEPAINDASCGLMQLLERTARALGYTGPRGDRYALTGLFHPATNVEYGCRLLRDLQQPGRSIESVISAYNGGVRPDLGFGAPATRAVRVCLARDQVSGECIRWQNVAPGEYANQAYVSKVRAAYDRWSGYLAASAVIPPQGPVGQSDPLALTPGTPLEQLPIPISPGVTKTAFVGGGIVAALAALGAWLLLR